ncbi:MAG: ABC transporter ATP-binding protein [Desulfoprunum sp.]|nr:ABC transporter ATP-binding protein [Desulfoprunum sp.]
MKSAAPTVIIDRVSLSFGDRILFDNLSLRLDGGRTTCILGPSGCGKSTLLKLIAGSGPFPFTGSIHLNPQETKREVAWMGQNDLLLPWLSLIDNVLLGARLRHELTEDKRKQARSLLLAAGLGDHAQALPATLSGGMRQRGALLRTLMEGRDILLMDEPFSALDALTRMRLQDLAAGMISGRTVVLVTHDPMEALRLADRILVLAGSPVRLAADLQPPGRPPRDPGRPEITRQYADLLKMLMNGDGV